MPSISQIQTEIDCSYLYSVLAKNEADTTIAKIFHEMSAIELSHAVAFMKKNSMDTSIIPPPSLRAKILNKLGKTFGYDFVLGILLDSEKSLSNAVLKSRKQLNLEKSISDTAHVAILENILENKPFLKENPVARFEQRHRSVGGNALRAAVLGGNDGLVSNFSLVMGIAGASSGQKEVLIAGFAGLLAGALSMALGEWISVKSSQELYENQMDLEMEELEINPEGEEKELALIYISKGISEDKAKKMAADVMLDKENAHKILVQEELGINPEELKNSAMEAAVASFIFFAIGAIIPVIPFLFSSGLNAIIASVVFSSIGLFLIGASITLFTGKSIWYSGFRQVLFGLIAAGITFFIGKWVGVSLLS